MLREGMKVHVVYRRLVEDEVRKHFVGEVIGHNDVAMLVRGHAFVFDINSGRFRRKEDTINRLVPTADGCVVVTVLPDAVELASVDYSTDHNGILELSDGKGFSFDINEFGVIR